MRSYAVLQEDAATGMRPFEPIIEVVKTGKPGFDIAHGMGGFEFFAAHPDLARKFQATMSERTAAFARSVAAGFDFSPVRTVADIGGGRGTLLAAILRAHGHLRGVLFDLPSMVGAAEETSDAVKLSSCLAGFLPDGGEGDGLVVVLAGGQAAVQAAEEPSEEVALGGGVPVAGLAAAVVVGAGAG